jgi:hypothetical protein
MCNIVFLLHFIPAQSNREPTIWNRISLGIVSVFLENKYENSVRDMSGKEHMASWGYGAFTSDLE